MEKKMENEMETGLYRGFIKIRVRVQGLAIFLAFALRPWLVR